jgi:hypothetical protein
LLGYLLKFYGILIFAVKVKFMNLLLADYSYVILLNCHTYQRKFAKAIFYNSHHNSKQGELRISHCKLDHRHPNISGWDLGGMIG